MIGHSRDLEATVQGSHKLHTHCDVIQHGQVVDQLEVIIKGTVTADNTAARLRNLQMTVADPNATLAQAGMTPFLTRLRPHRGARIPHISFVGKLRNDAASWAGGDHIGTSGASGALTMT
jgi:hypothetical protein